MGTYTLGRTPLGKASAAAFARNKRAPLGKASAAAFARNKRLPPWSAADALVGLPQYLSRARSRPGPAADQVCGPGVRPTNSPSLLCLSRTPRI